MRSAWILPLLLGACATSGSATHTATPTRQAADTARAAIPARQRADTARTSLLASGQPPHALHWTRTSAEHHAILVQAYHGAEARLRELAASLPGGSWAVIMDADETVLDNSLYFQQQAEQGRLGFSFRSWIEFVKEAKAPALPGAVHFTHLIHELGGRLVIVSNRAENLCADTRRNLERARIPADAVLCRPRGGDDKNARFAAVQSGQVEGLPPLHVVMWVGDNVQDFPSLTQAEMEGAPDSAFSEFGHSWWILPNPIYGSWERNPLPADP